MEKNCKKCGIEFKITKNDLDFYDKVSPVFNGIKYHIPEPTLCLPCRQQQKFSFRNERTLYKRKCDLCNKRIVSLYHEDSNYIVYCQECWWSDKYDPLKYGIGFDFSRNFFEQYNELNLKVPKPAIQNTKSDNCAYTNYSAENKNCYMCVGTLGSEDCYHSYRIFYSNNILDCFDLYKCELCYECSESSSLYNSLYCIHCQNSSNLTLCEYCIGCHDCFGCINLKNKQYYIYNKKYSSEEYFEKINKLQNNIAVASNEFRKLKNISPYKSNNIINSINSTGDNLINCKNCENCFTLKNSEDCKDFVIGENHKDCHDVCVGDNCELQYNSANLEKNYQVIGGNLVWYVKNAYYVSLCFNSNNLFACTGIKKGEYIIFNRQYSKLEYEKLAGKILEHMKKTGEWCEFFPSGLSPFGYNETVANEYYPLTKEEALKKGFKWSDYESPIPKVDKIIPASKLPDDIKDIPDDILNWAIRCEVTNKPYKIIPQELKFYRDHNLPIPRRHPDQRHKDRMSLRNPRKLWSRSCDKCTKEIQTTYSPERPEKILCEECYLKEVY